MFSSVKLKDQVWLYKKLLQNMEFQVAHCMEDVKKLELNCPKLFKMEIGVKMI